MTCAFVLPGGASLGAVQVGMLEALLEAGITPDFIVGTSAGALNGCWLAGHPDVDGVAELRQLWKSVRRKDVFPLSPLGAVRALAGRRDHVVSAGRLERWLSERVPFQRLEDATVPLHVMATDLMTGEPVVLSTGDIVAALLASTAMPGIFPPVSIDGRLLVDGGVTSDTPVPEAVQLGADVIYVLPTVGVERGSRPRSAPGVALLALAHMLGHASDSEVAASAATTTVYVAPAPATGSISPFNFDHSEELMDTGFAATRAWLADPVPVV